MRSVSGLLELVKFADGFDDRVLEAVLTESRVLSA